MVMCAWERLLLLASLLALSLLLAGLIALLLARLVALLLARLVALLLARLVALLLAGLIALLLTSLLASLLWTYLLARVLHFASSAVFLARVGHLASSLAASLLWARGNALGGCLVAYGLLSLLVTT